MHMGQRDIVLKNYLSDPSIFADLFNGILFGGKQVLRAEMLTELDSTETMVLQAHEWMPELKQRFRDVAKKAEDGTRFVVLGVENQTEVDYSMVVRSQLYDVLNYADQVEMIRREHVRKGDLQGKERLCGFAKTDVLRPVITLVLYYGSEPWNAAVELTDLFDKREPIGEYEGFLQNYGLNLVRMGELENPEIFKSGLRQICGLLKAGRGKKRVKQFLDERREEYAGLDEATFDVIKVLMDMPWLEEWKRSNRGQEEGGYNMLKGFEEYWEEEREKVRVETRKELREEVKAEVKEEVKEEVKAKVKAEVQAEVQKELRQEGIKLLIQDNLEEGKTPERIQEKLIRRFSLSREQAEQYYNRFAPEEH